MPGVGTLAYDARNRITGTGGVPTRGYDPANRKLWWTDTNPGLCVDFWLPTGEKLATLRMGVPTASGEAWADKYYFWFGGRQVLSQRMSVSNSRTVVPFNQDWPQPDRLSSNARHHPYGEERSTSSTEYKFATYQREASGLDYALNRYYSSVCGRFLSSDPAGAASPDNPGSRNQYAYVGGDPINLHVPKACSLPCHRDALNSIS